MRAQLDNNLVQEPGGAAKAFVRAQETALQDVEEVANGSAADDSPVASAMPLPQIPFHNPARASSSSSADSRASSSSVTVPHSILRRRRKSSSQPSTAQAVIQATRPIPSGADVHPVLDEELHVLCFHPEPAVSDLANACADLLDDMTSKGVLHTQWPANLTYVNYFDYLLVPTLVYELEYPRTHEIRPMYVVEKTLATFGTFSLLYIITEHYILPVTQLEDSSFWGMALDLAAPFMINYILIFYISTLMLPCCLQVE